jgi:hypothetical protein
MLDESSSRHANVTYTRRIVAQSDKIGNISDRAYAMKHADVTRCTRLVTQAFLFPDTADFRVPFLVTQGGRTSFWTGSTFVRAIAFLSGSAPSRTIMPPLVTARESRRRKIERDLRARACVCM